MKPNRIVCWMQLVMLTVFSIFFMSSASLAATYYIDATEGNDSYSGTSQSAAWKTITKVNGSNFSPGDQILFKRGETWTGTTLSISSDGAEGNHINIGVYGTGDKPIIDGTGLSKTVYLNGRSFITINNLEVKKGGHGIFITPSSINGQINIMDCEIHDSEDNNISIKDRGNVTIESCKIYNSAANGISAYSADTSSWGGRTGHNVKLLGNFIYNNSKSGFFVYGDDAIVRNNEMYGNGGGDKEGYYHNIYISGDNAIVEKNILRDATYGDGLRFLGSNLTVRYNFIRHNRKHGIGIWNDYPVDHSNLNISYNLFIQRDYAETPVSLPLAINIDNAAGAGNFSNIKIYNNSVYGENDNANGFLFRKCSNVDFRNNIIYLKNAYLIGEFEGASIASDYNIFMSDKPKAFFTDTEATFSQWQGEGYDQHSKETDPKFTDPKNNNLTLQSNSPAMSAGQNLGQAYDDGLHPDGGFPYNVAVLDQDNYGGWEIGAYVYSSDEPPAAPKNIRVE